jgi:hypothetical protein
VTPKFKYGDVLEDTDGEIVMVLYRHRYYDNTYVIVILQQGDNISADPPGINSRIIDDDWTLRP